MLNAFQDNNFFNLTTLTEAINILPNQYGRVGEMGLFLTKGVRTSNIAIEEQNGSLCLLPFQSRGGAAYMADRTKRKIRSFNIPHIPYEDLILPDEVNGIRAFGTENEMETVAKVVNEHLQMMKNKHEITLESLRMGALKGIILDANGDTLYDLYTEFGITQETVSFALSDATTNVKKKCLEVVRHIEDNLKGEFCNGIHALVSSEFFDALTSHAKVKEAYERWQDGTALRDDMRKGFPFGGIVFEEYRGQATQADGTTTQRFIAANEGHAFPMGTYQTFRTYFAPADFNETVNTIGQPLYAKQITCEFERGVKIHTQSNPLPLCLRPAVLVKLTA